jgi:shikimate dehydrogenase
MTDKYAVIGNPIVHSKSPIIHMKFAEMTGQNIVYTKIEGPLGGFREAIEIFRTTGGAGVNVTTPFKLDAFAYATKLTEQARLAGAVNALKFERGEIIAQNFDGIGLVRDIVHNLGYPMVGKRVLLLGAGGAARGSILPFLSEKPAQLVIINRTTSKAKGLVDKFSIFAERCEFSHGSYTELGESSEKFDMVINATSASMRGELPPVSANVFKPGCLAYELAYAKGLTPFLRFAQGAGAGRLADGVGLLVEQAAEAFEWWRGVRPSTASMITALTIPLL